MKKIIILAVVAYLQATIVHASTIYHCSVVVDGKDTFKKIELPDYNPFSDPHIISLGSVRGEEISLQNGETNIILQLESDAETKVVTIEKGHPIYYRESKHNKDVLSYGKLEEIIVFCD